MILDKANNTLQLSNIKLTGIVLPTTTNDAASK